MIHWRPYTGNKAIRLSPKEIQRADPVAGITVVVRPQPDGTWLVVPVKVDTGQPFGAGSFVAFVEDKSEISEAVYQQLRMLDKMGGSGGDLADASRHRSGPKWDKLKQWTLSLEGKQAGQQVAGDFWEEMRFATGPLDQYLQGRHEENPSDVPLRGQGVDGDYFSQLQALTEGGRKKYALPLPVLAGTRVRFVANLGSVLTYDDIPGDGVLGTVVTVKTSSGNVTSHEGNAFVLWDDGVFRSILADHLRAAKGKTASTVRIVTANLGDISSLFGAARSAPDELVHKATKDLWSFRKDGEQFVLERLFSDTGKPLKV